MEVNKKKLSMLTVAMLAAATGLTACGTQSNQGTTGGGGATKQSTSNSGGS